MTTLTTISVPVAGDFPSVRRRRGSPTPVFLHYRACSACAWDQVTGQLGTACRLRLAPRTAQLRTGTAHLLSLGASRPASGSTAVSWALLADIEGNESDLVADEARG